MAEFILNEKRILAVDDEPDVLAVLEEEIKEAWPNSRFDKASTYEEVVARMISLMYDVVILDIMGDRVEIPFFNQTGVRDGSTNQEDSFCNRSQRKLFSGLPICC